MNYLEWKDTFPQLKKISDRYPTKDTRKLASETSAMTGIPLLVVWKYFGEIRGEQEEMQKVMDEYSDYFDMRLE